MELIFASNNKHKLKEVRHILEPDFKILSLAEIQFNDELEETTGTIEGNARQKAAFIYKKFKRNCFADDTGLEIEYLNGRPGVFSARYAGPACNPEENMHKVLEELKNVSSRRAVFRCVISLFNNGIEKQFEGRMPGEILFEKQGNEGFGYDPIFAPDMPSGGNKQKRSFAEMTMEEKNLISHRAIAVKKMKEYLLSFKTL